MVVVKPRVGFDDDNDNHVFLKDAVKRGGRAASE